MSLAARSMRRSRARASRRACHDQSRSCNSSVRSNAISLSAAYSHAIAADASGNVYLAGYFTGSIDFGGGLLSSAGSSDLYVASFSSSGAYRWARAHGSTGADPGRGQAMDSGGNVYVTGYFTRTMNLGGGAMTSKGSYDIFLLKLVP